MKKYEYKVINATTIGFWKPKLETNVVTEEMNKMGQDGWELVSVMDTSVGYGQTNEILLFFKREARF
jgi:hypothetical protein